MSAARPLTMPRAPASERALRDVVVIGAGPVGTRLAQTLAGHDLNARITVFGAEARAPYDRVGLSSFLAGDLDERGLALATDSRGACTISRRLGCRVRGIDRERGVVIDHNGEPVPYDTLVLATGSRPRVPNIEGLDRPGVFTFRDLDDAEALAARRLRSRHTVIIGGGLLGLETARAMRRFNTAITVLEHTPRLMFNHLDEAAAALLTERIERMQIRVRTGVRVTAVSGAHAIEAVCLEDGSEIPCDTLIVAAGITPRIELARDAGLAVGRGIRVDDEMRTSDPHIFAVGECAEHRGVVYGLVAPGLDQAAVAASVIAGERARYRGGAPATRLKVLSVPVFSSGEVTDSHRPVTILSHRQGRDGYRMLSVDRGRVVGACAIGEWQDGARIQELVQRGGYLWPWQRLRFTRCGSPWPQDADASAASWPAAATICNCTGVTRGDLGNALAAGCTSVAELSAATRAASVCGSCQPLLEQVLGGNAAPAPTPAWRTLSGLSVLVLAAVVALLALPPAPYAATVQVPWNWNVLWQHTVWKESSGYALLACALLAGALSLRKRLPEVHRFSYAGWRVAHVVIGTVIAGLLFVHTGFRGGVHLNAWLMASFVLALASGAAMGALVASEHRLRPRLARGLRSASLWLHVLVLWPLPVLLGFHVLKTYYF